MVSIKLDIFSFKKVLALLLEAMDAYQQQSNNLYTRDALIHRFKYTYELSHKSLKRYLKITEPSTQEIDQMSFPNLIRTGFERGLLLNGWDKWNTYRNARNLTSHTYNEQKAIQVCQVIPLFLNDATHLLAKLRERIAAQ